MRYWEDVTIGDKAAFGRYAVDRNEVIDFATRYDPQPFHLSDDAAAKTHFRTLAASGWHTCGMMMAMLVEHMQADGAETASLGAAGIDELRWLKPVHPGDVLRMETEAVDKRPSASRPDMGIVRTRSIVFNQNDEPVLSLIAIALWRRRPVTHAA